MKSIPCLCILLCLLLAAFPAVAATEDPAQVAADTFLLMLLAPEHCITPPSAETMLAEALRYKELTTDEGYMRMLQNRLFDTLPDYCYQNNCTLTLVSHALTDLPVSLPEVRQYQFRSTILVTPAKDGAAQEVSLDGIISLRVEENAWKVSSCKLFLRQLNALFP